MNPKIEGNRRKIIKAKAGEEVCIICEENRQNIVMIPCRHKVTCLTCAKKMEICPICRQQFTMLPIYLS